MAGAGRDPEPPRDEVPHNCAGKAPEDDGQGDDARIDNALADRRGHFERDEEHHNEVEEGCHGHRLERGQRLGSNNRGDAVGCVVKAVGEVKDQRDGDQADGNPQCGGDHPGALLAGWWGTGVGMRLHGFGTCFGWHGHHRAG